MKVWIINHYAIPPNHGGLVRHYYFSKYLSERGHEIKIFTSSKIHNTDVNVIENKTPYLEKKMEGVNYTFIRNSDYSGNGFDRIINILQFPIRIWKICKKFEKPDIIYTSSPDLLTAWSAVLLAKHLKVKKIVEIRDLWPESIVEYGGKSKRNPVIFLLYQLEKWLYVNADKLIFTMEGGKKYIEEKKWDTKIDLAKIEHLNNGVDLEEFVSNQNKYFLIDNDLESSDVFKVVYTGSIRTVNNIEVLVNCAELLKLQNSKSKLLIWGDGNQRAELEQRCKELKLDNIVFKGKVDKKFIPYILTKANVNLLHWKFTSLMRFGMSANKLFDYLAAGRPILSDINSEFNLVAKYKCGVTVDDSAETLAKTIVELEKLPVEEMNKYAQNSINLAKEYDYRKLADSLEKILQETIHE